MEISRGNGEECTDVSMVISPDHIKVWAVVGMTTDGINCQAVVSSHCDTGSHLTLLC